MTRRLSILILLLVWATLVAGGAAAYLTTRTVLLTDLDAALIRRARALPEVANTQEAAPPTEDAAGDRYLIANQINQTRGRLAESASGAQPIVLHTALATLGDGSLLRTLTLRFTQRADGGPITVVYSGSAQRVTDMLQRLTVGLTLFGIVAGIAAAGLAILVSRAALRPLRTTADAIAAIDAQKLDQRIDAASLPSELRPVASQLNDALDRIQEVFAQRKQFLADASHELRTPVAALVTTLEVSLRRPRDAAELTRVLQSCLSDARMLRQLVMTLLEHARGEAPGSENGTQTFNALAHLERCADVADGLALEKHVTIRRTLPPELTLRSQPMRLRGIVMNLLANAVEHNRPGGTVDLRVEVNGQTLDLEIRDTGKGIAAEDLPHIFQPFYRARHSTQPADPDEAAQHLGLGLFLVDSHIRALGGVRRVESQLGVGTTVSIHFPGVVVGQPVELEVATA